MNEIETWFDILTTQAIRRGTFDWVKALVVMIEAFIRSWTAEASPFMWVKTATGFWSRRLASPR